MILIKHILTWFSRPLTIAIILIIKYLMETFTVCVAYTAEPETLQRPSKHPYSHQELSKFHLFMKYLFI